MTPAEIEAVVLAHDTKDGLVRALHAAWERERKIDVDGVRQVLRQIAALTARLAALTEALEAISRRAPIMGSAGDYRKGQEHALEACRAVACAALAPPPGEGECGNYPDLGGCHRPRGHEGNCGPQIS